MIKKATFLFILMTVITYSQVGWQFVSAVPNAIQINSITAVDQNVIFVCCDGGKVFRSVNGGVAWQNRSTGLPAVNCYGISAVDSLTCWVGSGQTNGAIYKTTDGGLSWVQQINVAGSFINGIKMFDANYGWYFADPTGSGQPYQFRYTTNGGTNWILSPSAPIATSEFGVINAWDFIDTSKIWAGSANTTASPTTAKIYKSTTGMSGTWSFGTGTGTGGTQGLYWQAIGFTDALNGMAGSNNNNIIKTTNGGATWVSVVNPSGLTAFAAMNIHAMKDGSNVIRLAVSTTAAGRLFKTTNLGSTWTEETLPAQVGTGSLQHIQFLNNNYIGFAGGANGIFLKYTGVVPVELTSFAAVSSPGKVSLNWKTATETNNRGFEVERKIDDGVFIVIAFKNGNGTTLETKEYSYSDDISSLNAGSLTYRLRQIDLNGGSEYSKEVLVNDIVPVEYTLEQNFPNPFNPNTTIKYRIPESGFVSLKVYNSLGQEAITLVNENKGAGTYEVELNALNLTSGIYYYVLKVNEFFETKKMTLLK